MRSQEDLTDPLLKNAIKSLFIQKLSNIKNPSDTEAILFLQHMAYLAKKNDEIKFSDLAAGLFALTDKNKNAIYVEKLCDILTSEEVSELISHLINLEYETKKGQLGSFMRDETITITLIRKQIGFNGKHNRGSFLSTRTSGFGRGGSIDAGGVTTNRAPQGLCIEA